MRIFNYIYLKGDRYMKLSNRLLEIVNFVPQSSIVADIGTDHGYIPVYLVEQGISNRVIATDISKKSLEKTIEYVRELGLEKNIETRLGDGFKVIKEDEVDTAIIAGMGGILMGDILGESVEVIDSITHFIFQPMVASCELRRYLVKNGFQIIDEGLAKEDDKFYEIIYARRGKSSEIDEVNYEIGQRLIEKKHPLLEEFIGYKIDILDKILEEIKYKDSLKSRNRHREVQKMRDSLQEVLSRIASD